MLSEFHPNLFKPLRKIPRKLEFPKQKPKEPSHFKDYVTLITPEDNWESLVQKIGCLNNVSPSSISVRYGDINEGEDELPTCRSKKGIFISYNADNLDYSAEYERYYHELNNFENKIENARKRNVEIEEIIFQNNEMIRTSIERNKTIWIVAVRIMKSDPDNFRKNYQSHLNSNVCPD
jgi:hypothetical protein